MIREGKEILYEEKGRGSLGISYEEKYDIWVLHFEITEEAWSYSQYRKCLMIFARLIQDLKRRGITELYGFSLSKKAERLVKMFGFTLTPAIGLSEGITPFSVLKLEI